MGGAAAPPEPMLDPGLPIRIGCVVCTHVHMHACRRVCYVMLHGRQCLITDHEALYL